MRQWRSGARASGLAKRVQNEDDRGTYNKQVPMLKSLGLMLRSSMSPATRALPASEEGSASLPDGSARGVRVGTGTISDETSAAREIVQMKEEDVSECGPTSIGTL